ncbi:MAG: GH92 family glycosyl hydrolase [Bacteroidota bacterium]
MNSRTLWLICLSSCLLACQADQSAPSVDPLLWVDPMVGTGFHGHTFPGPTTPFGMVQLSPDTHLPGWDASSGYHADDSVIYGFSHTHLSGTGIGDMGDILLLPYTGTAVDSPLATFSKPNEQAEAGYYSVEFDNYAVKSELTASPRTGMHRYTFAEGESAQVFLNLGHTLQPNWGHRSEFAQLEIVDDHTLRGYRLSRGWAHHHPVYFYAHFSQSFEVIRQQNGTEALEEADILEGPLLKVWLQFPEGKQVIEAQVGISPVSLSGAEANWKAEAKGNSFEKIRAQATKQWQSALAAITIQSQEASVMKNFYTSLYHCMMAPQLAQDVDGRYRGMDWEIHQAPKGFTNYTVFSMWDTFRALHPLLTIIDESRSQAFVASLLDKYEKGGLLPKWALASNYTGTMVGYPAVSIIADAATKGVIAPPYDAALEAAVQSSRYRPEWLATRQEERAPQAMIKQVDFVNRGPYIPSDSVGQSVSYGLECAYYDWCIARLAEASGDAETQATYEERAKAYRHYFDPEVGFMRGKLANGDWREPFSASYSDHEQSDYVEGNAWQWSWFVPHDVAGMAKLFGGDAQMAAKLDELFTTTEAVTGEGASADITGLIGQYAHGNEPSHHVAHFYNYLGQAGKTQQRVDQILQELYAPTPAGISGNEDCGAMSAWYVMNALGFYQMAPGDPTYSIGRPIVDQAQIQLPNGNTFEIIAHNQALDHYLIDRMELNGTTLDQPFFTHEQLMAGGRLEMWMR